MRENSTIKCPACSKHDEIEVEFEDGISGYFFRGSSSKRYFIVNNYGDRDYLANEDDAIKSLYFYKAFGKFK